MENWDKINETMKEYINTLHNELGWFTDEELQNTPKRISRFYKELYDNHKYKFTLFPAVKDSMIVINNVEMYSLCAHHMLPFFGKVSIAYLPKNDGKIAGVSKLARAVVKTASQPQTQEYLSQELINELVKNLDPQFAMVKITAQHMCMMMRGIKQQESIVTTTSLYVSDEMKPELATLKAEAMELMT